MSDISRAFGPTPEERAEEEKKRDIKWRWIGPQLFEVALSPQLHQDLDADPGVLSDFKYAAVKRALLEERTEREDGWMVARLAGSEIAKFRNAAKSFRYVRGETKMRLFHAIDSGPNAIDLIGGLST